MSDLRQAAQQVLDAWQTSLYGKPSHQKAVVLAMTNLNIVLQQQAEPVAQRSDGMPISKMERELRRMLCIERHGRSAYMDDGEASFCGDKYCRSIDYMRESVDSIKQAWYDAGVKKLAGAQPEQQAEPIGWLDGNDKLAEFMHRDLKAEHDKRGSATPKDFTIPVYTTLPQQQAEPVAWEHHAKKLTHWLHCMSYNDSYFGEPAGLVKQVTAELNSLIGTAPPQQQAEPVNGDIRALKYRIHELEGEVIGYKRMLDVAEAVSQRKPLTCPWSPHDDETMPGTYRTACGELWSFIDDGWKDNRVGYCHGCGGKVVEATHRIQEPKP